MLCHINTLLVFKKVMAQNKQAEINSWVTEQAIQMGIYEPF